MEQLLEGNRRFSSGENTYWSYGGEKLESIARNQNPIAAIIGCADSRVTPEIVFDQPLGAIFCSRVPGNVASDSAAWTVDIAVSHFRIPLVLVMGHTNCLAVTQIVQGQAQGVGGPLRSMIAYAVHEARESNPADLMRTALERNVRMTVEELPRRCSTLHRAIVENNAAIVGALYDMESGRVQIL